MRAISALFVVVLLVAAFETARAEPATLQRSEQAASLYSRELRDAQFERLRAMADVDVEYDQFGRVRTVNGASGIRVANAAQLKAGDSTGTLLGELKAILMATGSESLVVRHAAGAINGGQALFMDVSIDGIPVVDGGVNIRVNKDGEIDLLGSTFVSLASVDRTKIRRVEDSKEDLLSALEMTGTVVRAAVSFRGIPSLGLWTNNGSEPAPFLVWCFDVSYSTEQGESAGKRFFVDAVTGQLRGAHATQFGLNRTAYSLNYTNGSTLVLLWNEGNVPAQPDSSAIQMYTRVAKPIQTWSLVGAGLAYATLAVGAHHVQANNAVYDRLSPSNLPILMAGDNMVFQDDPIAHEYGHGIFMPLMSPQPSAWWNEWFAANEFWGDISAALTSLNNSEGSPWQISNPVLRNLANPKLINSDYRDWYWERKFSWVPPNVREDMAYKNSTIYGLAFHLLVQGGTHPRAGQAALKGPIPSINVAATPHMVAASVFAYALVNLAVAGGGIDAYKLKAATEQTASALGGPVLVQNVTNAWLAVGVGYQCSSPPAIPVPTIRSQFCQGKYNISWAQTPNVTYHGMVRPWYSSFEISGQSTTDGPVASCKLNLPDRGYWRMRACNACGCSGWAGEYYLDYWSPCQ